ncbi:hypothetical protein EMCRGX_G006345 [Ephydatia muelleri]
MDCIAATQQFCSCSKCITKIVLDQTCVITNNISANTCVVQDVLFLGTDVMVTSQPQNLTNVLPGRMANFSVTAAGADSFTFQWQYGNGTNIPPRERYGGYAKNYGGQIGSSKQYFISKLNFDAIPGMIVAGGVVWCLLLCPPTTMDQHQYPMATSGLRMVWLSPMEGGWQEPTNPTLSISNVMPQDQGLYQCNVTNVDGVTRLSISSSFVVSGEPCAIVKKRELDEMFVLTLDTVIVTQPSNQSGVAPGSIVTFSVYAVPVVGGDGGSISYVWTYSNGSQLAGDRFQGINTSTLTISSSAGFRQWIIFHLHSPVFVDTYRANYAPRTALLPGVMDTISPDEHKYFYVFGGLKYLYVNTDTSIYRLPVQRCGRYLSCRLRTFFNLQSFGPRTPALELFTLRIGYCISSSWGKDQLLELDLEPQGLWTRYRANYAPRTALLPGVMNTISPDEHKYFYVFTRDVDTTITYVMVTSQPQNVTNVLPGRMASFSVTAAGADSFTFQWQYGNGTNIPPGDRYGDVTTPTLVISSVIGGDNSSVYVCRE